MKTLRKMARRQVSQFLSALFLPNELIELRFIESWLSDGKKRSRVVRAAQWLQRADVVAMHADLTAFAKRALANIYFGVCPRPRHGDADDGSIRTVRCVWCDIDPVTRVRDDRRELHRRRVNLLQPLRMSHRGHRTPGDARVNPQAVRAHLPDGWKRLSFATGEEIEAVTGFGQGAVAPLGLPEGVPVILDVSFAGLEKVNISSGDPMAGLELKAADLIRAAGARLAPIVS